MSYHPILQVLSLLCPRMGARSTPTYFCQKRSCDLVKQSGGGGGILQVTPHLVKQSGGGGIQVTPHFDDDNDDDCDWEWELYERNQSDTNLARLTECLKQRNQKTCPCNE